ncbi:hypothetical protein BAU15_01755 [Enterococcus sp. JM4C]|uniref:ABC transporter substrate-binding protein n=1 Tax=Candidatus Enterococcus huntleyi TaxID=1857217 RepID=UPI00137B3726|nr:extracellular solute-binding protein [Enterococcus sp. JM4C]KAF1299398.1 hypothetical protein BAU15_01755 [Enterococcus sp. JM4C]
MLKKKLLVLVSLLAMTFVGAACGKSSESEEKKESNELIVWGWDKSFNGYAMDQAKEVYKEKTGKDVEIKFVEMAKADALKKLHTALASGVTDSLPDVVLISDLNAQGYLLSYPDAFVPMDDMINYNDFASYKKDALSYDGKGYGVPFDTGVAGLFYRTDYMAEIGYDAEKMQNLTWEEYLSLGEKLKEKGHLLQTFNPNDNSELQIMLQSAGTWFTDDDGKANFTNNDALKESLGIFKTLNDSDFVKVVSDWTEFTGAINGGEVATVMRGSWISPTVMAAEDQSGKWAVAPVPTLSVENATHYSNQGGSSWFVLNKSANSKLAGEFLKNTFGESKDLYATLLKEKNVMGTYLPATESDAYDGEEEFYGGQQLNRDLATWLSKVPEVNTGAYTAEAQTALLGVAPEIFKGGGITKNLSEAEKQFEQSIK